MKENDNQLNLQDLIESRFWEHKSIKGLSQKEWEALCDGCGKCCFRKYVEGHFKNKRTYLTRIACDCLNLENGLCSCYLNRFAIQKDCIQLNVRKLKNFKWLPETCSYRVFYEKGVLPDFHPLLNGGSFENVPKICNPVHEKDVDFNDNSYMDFVIEIQ